LVGLGLALALYAISDDPFYGTDPGFGKVQAAILIAGLLLIGSARLPIAWVQRILVLAISSLVTLAIAEVAAWRLLAPRFRPAFVRDDRLLFKLAPDRDSEFTRTDGSGGGRYLTHVNKDGYVGKELLPTGTRPRVVVYGDSFIHTYYVDPKDGFAQQLENDLSRRLGTGVEVVNAGVAAYGPDQIALRMEDELPKLQPDLVVVAVFGGNDFGDLVRDKIFRLDPGGVLRLNHYTLDPRTAASLDTAQRTSVLMRALWAAWDRLRRAPSMPGTSDAPTARLDRFLERAVQEYDDFEVKHSDVVSNLQQDDYNADIALLPNSEPARFKVRLMEAVLRRIGELAARSHVPLVLMFIPYPGDVADHYDGVTIDRTRFPDYRRENITDALQSMAERNGLTAFNLWGTFRPLDAGTLFLHGGDNHWNEAGQHLAAEGLADFIIAHRLLGTGDAVDAGRRTDGAQPNR
jgi:lysophospholipase L1-like esterase